MKTKEDVVSESIFESGEEVAPGKTQQEIAKELLMFGDTWAQAWNTDDYDDGICLRVHKGVTVVPEKLLGNSSYSLRKLMPGQC